MSDARQKHQEDHVRHFATKHPHWSAELRFDYDKSLVTFVGSDNSGGSFVQLSVFFIIDWIDHDAEVFILRDGLLEKYFSDFGSIQIESYIVRLPGSDFLIRLRKNDSDMEVFNQNISLNDLDIKMKYNVKTIIDLGANIGISSLYFAARYPMAKVFAVEPGKENFALLCENTKQVADRVNVLRGAAWSHGDGVKMLLNNESGAQIDGFALRVGNVESLPAEKYEIVDSFTMPQILEKSGFGDVDLVKIDIEGAEKFLLAGDIEWLRRTKFVVAESHDRIEPGSHKVLLDALQDFELTSKNGANMIFVNRKLIAAEEKLVERKEGELMTHEPTTSEITNLPTLATGKRGLHIGCGIHVMEGWLNVDSYPQSEKVMFLDATQPFPFANESFDVVFSEHMIEHVPYASGIKMLTECFRVLKPGGRVRITTPDLKKLIGVYQNPNLELHARYLRWQHDLFCKGVPSDAPGFFFNHFVRGWGHLFIYDYSTLSVALVSTGFREVTARELNDSDTLEFQMLEAIDRLPEGFLELESMVLEGLKPLV